MWTIHFIFKERGRLRSKWKDIEAKTESEAIRILERQFGWINVIKTIHGK